MLHLCMCEGGVRGSVMIRYLYQNKYAAYSMKNGLGDAMDESRCG